MANESKDDDSELEIELEEDVQEKFLFKDMVKKKEIVQIDSDDDIEITSAHLASDNEKEIDGKKSTEHLFKSRS